MPRVLIIDDHENVRLLYRETFEIAGFDVEEAVNGQQGIDRYTEGRADVVITDIQMPEKDGFDVIQEIRKIDADAKVIAVTGAGLHNLPVAHELGADQIFEKPIRPEDLVQAARDLIA